MKLVRTLLIILLVIFPLGQLVRISFGFGINILPIDLVIFLIDSVWIFGKIINKISFKKYSLSFPIFLFVTVALISLLVNISNLSFLTFFASFLYLVRFAFYAGIYFVLLDQPSSFQKKFVIFLMMSGFAMVIGGFIQYFLYPDLRNLRYLGWDEHLYRLFSSFLDPNFAGAFFALELILIASLLFRESLRQTWQKYGLLVMGFLTFIALLLTYSRGAYLMFLISLSIVLILHDKVKWLIILILFFLAGITLLPKNLQSEGVNFLRTASIGGRIESIENSIVIIKDHPLLGVGFNTYRFAQKKYGFLEEPSWQEIHSGGGVENSLLFVFATTGAIGLVVYLFLWYKIFSITSTVLLVSSIGLFIDSLFINSLFYPPLMLWIWMLCALTERD